MRKLRPGFWFVGNKRENNRLQECINSSVIWHCKVVNTKSSIGRAPLTDNIASATDVISTRRTGVKQCKVNRWTDCRLYRSLQHDYYRRCCSRKLFILAADVTTKNARRIDCDLKLATSRGIDISRLIYVQHRQSDLSPPQSCTFNRNDEFCNQ